MKGGVSCREKGGVTLASVIFSGQRKLVFAQKGGVILEGKTGGTKGGPVRCKALEKT